MDKQTFMQYLHGMDGCIKALHIRVLRMDEGEAAAQMPMEAQNSNFMGAIHGGALATLADVVAGCCLFYRGRVCVTLNSSIQYLRGIRGGTAHATAKEVHAGGHISVIQVEIRDDEGTLCVTATITMYLTETTAAEFLGE